MTSAESGSGPRALFFEAPRQVAVLPVELRAPTDGEIRCQGLASAVSQGTELLLYRGEGPEAFDPGLETYGYPCRYGYSWVGTAEGKRVFSLATHATEHVLARSALRPMREDIPAPRATLAANLETALTCAWDAEAAIGERVVVIGAGVVGILVAWVLATSRVTLIDKRQKRLDVARALVPFAGPAPAPDGRADVVIEATGDPRALDDAIAWAAPGARIVVASFYGRRRASIDLGDAFHRRRLSLVASQVSSIPPRLSPRWDHARRFEVVQDLLGEPLLDRLISVVPFAYAPKLYERLDREEDLPPAHVFAY